MPKQRSKEEQREYQRRYRELQASLAKNETPALDVTPGPVTPAPRVTPVTPIDPPYAHMTPHQLAIMGPFSFVPLWAEQSMLPPSASAREAYEAHVVKTVAMTGRTPVENAAQGVPG